MTSLLRPVLPCPPSRPQRQRLVDHLKRTLQEDLLSSLHRKMELYSGCIDRLRRVHDSSNLEVGCAPLGLWLIFG